MLASEALSELSRLSAYSPSTVEGNGSGPAPLVRRQPAASDAAKVMTPTGPIPERRHRSAADVRSMLSGFQSGVTRGRAEPTDDNDSLTDPVRVPAGSLPANTPGTTRTDPARITDSRTTD